ncbi:eCIS core domain-containing protein [Dictyobacter formicarum]|uniref:eCIS core domain-containing protein n=1 Tax=Dictyobacter formicarum TaxID=2778368 RepID=A0ABQ3VAN1_9CHLR|nr:DUF4157 domain-containing protein [Dictyobacter formicarum]GHO83207.1 hypothetical protein KSZ_12130 [Dictyobacter formicarum]
MDYQRAMKAAQKGQPKTPVPLLRQPSFDHATTHPLLELQHTIGNQAVLNLLRSRNIQSDTPAQASIEPYFDYDSSQIPAYPLLSPVLQTKLVINQPGDQYEQEADRVANQTMTMPADHSISVASLSIPRFSGQSNGQIDTATASVNQALATPGRPLESTLRQDMEQRFGRDFSQVRIHSGVSAERSAHEVNANAYTVGHDIVFGAGQFVPETQEGRRLIAHELTHVVQQSGIDGVNVGQRTNNCDPLSHTTRLPLTVQRDSPKTPASPLPKLPQKIIPGSTHLSRQTQAYRVDHPNLPGGTNLVAFEYSVGNAERQVQVIENRAGVAHSEEMMDEFLQQLRRKVRAPITVHEIYSERQPCGPSEHDCEGLLLRRYPQAKTTFGYNYQETFDPASESRAGRTRTAIDAAHERLTRTRQLEWDFEKKTPPPHYERLEPGTPSTRPRRQRSRNTADTARAIAELDAQTARAQGFTARIRTYVAAYGVLQHTLSLLNTIEFAERIFFDGTVFPSEQRDANLVEGQSEKALSDAESVVTEQAHISAFIAAGEALRGGDQQALFALENSLVALNKEVSDSARDLSGMSAEIDAQAQAMLEASKHNKQAATQGMDDAAMAQAAALYISTEKLGNTLRTAAENYKSAAEMLSTYSTQINSIASQAEEAAWSLGYERIIEAQHEIDRQERAKLQPLTPEPTSTARLTVQSRGFEDELTEKSNDVLRFSKTGEEVTADRLISWAKRSHPRGLDDPTLLKDLYSSHEFNGSDDAHERAAVMLVLKLREEKLKARTAE